MEIEEKKKQESMKRLFLTGNDSGFDLQLWHYKYRWEILFHLLKCKSEAAALMSKNKS